MCWINSFYFIALSYWPFWAIGQLSEAGWVPDELVQDCDNLSKLWPVAASLLPAVQHELVQHNRTVHWSGKTVALIYCFDHLQGREGQISSYAIYTSEWNKNVNFARNGGGIHVFVTHILVGHLPVGSLSVWNHLPHDDTVTPHIAGWGELPVGDGLWSCPSDGDLPSLEIVHNTVNTLLTCWT